MKLTESKLRSIIREELSKLNEKKNMYTGLERRQSLELKSAIKNEFPQEVESGSISFKGYRRGRVEVTVFGDELARKVQRLADREGINLNLDINDPPREDPYPGSTL